MAQENGKQDRECMIGGLVFCLHWLSHQLDGDILEPGVMKMNDNDALSIPVLYQASRKKIVCCSFFSLLGRCLMKHWKKGLEWLPNC